MSSKMHGMKKNIKNSISGQTPSDMQAITFLCQYEKYFERSKMMFDLLFFTLIYNEITIGDKNLVEI